MKTLTGVIFLLIFSLQSLHAQNGCTELGQNPETAFPVCGKTTFNQKSVPICTNGVIYVPRCNPEQASGGYQAKNPFWYKFTCFESGTLSFLIDPKNPSDDYDWQLYDITGHDPKDALTDQSLVVTGNWAGTYGKTGAKADGADYIQCASNPLNELPSFAKSPHLQEGHTYLLMVSHFTDSQSGYGLSFEGGTAVITDTTKPRIQKAIPSCDGTEISILLSKEMKCSSLASDGSDFIIEQGDAKIVAASGGNCNQGFSMDSLALKLDHPLPPGEYTVAIQKGTDGNTLLDNCNTAVPVGEQLSFTVQEVEPTPIDHIATPGCAPDVIKVVFADAVKCESIAPDGSDFVISGPTSISIQGAAGIDCNNGLSRTIAVKLDHPIVKGGTYTVSLTEGSDQNTIINKCGKASPAGTSSIFTTKDTVKADITHLENYHCNMVTISLRNSGSNAINQWRWEIGNDTVNRQKFSFTDTTFQDRTILLWVSNGVCSDSSTFRLSLDKNFFIQADFEIPEFVCPDDLITFSNTSKGNIVSREWDLGNGHTSFLKTPPNQQYPSVVRTRRFPVTLRVQNSNGCTDTLTKFLKVINNCNIAVPTAFSPNGDGVNDYLYPLNAYKAAHLTFKIYNRWGQLIFKTHDWNKKWDGTFHGQKQPTGSYVWFLSYTNTDTGEKVFKRGTTALIR